MKAESNISPVSNFEIENLSIDSGSPCTVIFYQNIETLSPQSESEDARYRYDTYRMDAVYSETLESRIAANYDVWLAAAQAGENKTTDPTDAEKIADLENQLVELQNNNDMLTECLLEMSEAVYAG